MSTFLSWFSFFLWKMFVGRFCSVCSTLDVGDGARAGDGADTMFHPAGIGVVLYTYKHYPAQGRPSTRSDGIFGTFRYILRTAAHGPTRFVSNTWGIKKRKHTISGQHVSTKIKFVCS